MWRLSPRELLLLKGAGGEPFAHFVDRLIRAEAFQGGLSQSEVRTQLRVNIKDGGVDTQVTRSIPRDRSGWFGVPTCWQFKAVEAKEVNDKRYKRKKNGLQAEINKPHVKRLIAEGHAYRYCLLGDLPPHKLADWEEQLEGEARRIHAGAAAPRVVHGGHLLDWAERFPAVVAGLSDQNQDGLHWEAWAKNCLAVTKVYVPNPEWKDEHDRILNYADLNLSRIGEPCLLIGGAAGVGKTRLVFETLNESPASPGLVVYARDEQEARKLATIVANTPDQTAILVVDECSFETYSFLNENLRGHVDRIRVICLHNTGPMESFDVWLDTDSIRNNIYEIIRRNFADVSDDHCREYANFSRGFVRFAADMCLNDEDVAAGKLSRLLGSVEKYLRRRLDARHLPLVSLLALFHKVGFQGEMRSDVEVLSRIAHCTPQDFIDAVRVVRDAPGFVVQAGRYWYVTPEIVARALFLEGWRRWVESDLSIFFEALPEHLQRQVIERAATFGGEEVRDQLASFFRGWFGRLTAKDLDDPRATSLASAIIESGPEEYLARLRQILEGAEAGDVIGIKEDGTGTATGSRRTLVSLLEKSVSFPEFFEGCEACLFRLALHETRSHTGHHATELWRNLYSVRLSRTAAPFEQRIGILGGRISSPDIDEARLAFRGLDRVFEGSSGQLIGPPVFAGRIRPRDWQPASSDEEHACYLAAVKLCGEPIAHGDPDRRALALDVVVDHLDFLLKSGFLDPIAGAVAASTLKEEETHRLLNAVDRFLGFAEQIGHDRADVRRWVDSMRPSDFDGKLRAVCARQPWDRRFADDPQTQSDEVDELAVQIRSDPSRLLRHLDWLASHEARSAEHLGFALGRIDEGSVFGDTIFKQAIRSGAAALLRGYVLGMVFAQRRPTEGLVHLMAELEAAHPKVAVDILISGGDGFDALNRVIRLVESRAVSPRFLTSFARGIGHRDLTVEEVDRLLPYFFVGDADTARAGMKFLAMVLRFEKRRSQRPCIEAETVRSHAWRVIEGALPHIDGQLSYDCLEVVELLARYNVGRTANLLGQALVSESLDFENLAQQKLAEFATENPEAVMEGFGSALLDNPHRWRLQIRVFRDLVARISTQVLLAWVRKHGVDAARAIARHLPRPYLDGQGLPIVPEVLDLILREYDDDEVLNNFAAGVHSGESWWGDRSEQFRREAEDARPFLKHPNRRIREWARLEIDERTSMAESLEREHAERTLR
jgi:hypothetical protein